ncbi:HNH endonuclease [Streptomyces phage Bmoc]|uniref:HNH endonuclease n=1 Tax=Streptomyces phage Bmoc TaxID=2725629 RepID=A0A6M3SYK5_9CAUD|nr:HNH endonuclease [Streptomyces phage Bmoc]QJD50867.1 HNH endonuclease [Streptomyces phage Bmoc]
MGTKISIQELYERDKGICGLCGKRVTRKQLLAGLANRDHIVPASKGGTNRADNLRLTHYGCNIRRGNGEDNGEKGRLVIENKRREIFEKQDGLCYHCTNPISDDKETVALIRGSYLAHRECIRRDRQK